MDLDIVCSLHAELRWWLNAVVAQTNASITSAPKRERAIRFADFHHHGKVSRSAANAQGAGNAARRFVTRRDPRARGIPTFEAQVRDFTGRGREDVPAHVLVAQLNPCARCLYRKR